MTRLFHVYDMNKSGYLEQADYERIAANFCQIHGWPPGSEGHQIMHQAQIGQWQQIQAMADTNDDTQVSLTEYLRAYDSVSDEAAFYEATVNAIVNFTFDYFDRDKDGAMTTAEFVEVYAVFDLPAAAAETAFEQMDTDGDGRIYKTAALRLVQEFSLSDDPNAAGNVFFGAY
jgi:Ca2+-binding EF-hand superfamily protein